jgi:hypothetical protein
MSASLRASHYVGHHKKVLIDAKNQKDNSKSDVSSDVLFYRSMIAVGAEEQVIKVLRAIGCCRFEKVIT